MAQSPPFKPGIGYPADGNIELLRKLVWNTWFLATGGGGVSPGWVTVPASSTASGTAGQIAYDNSYFYVCVAADTWRRVAINDWS
jgi:hypothetical protein